MTAALSIVEVLRYRAVLHRPMLRPLQPEKPKAKR